MRHFILSCVVCLGFPNVSTLPHIQPEFREKSVIKLKICVLIFIPLLSEPFLIQRIQRDFIINIHRQWCKGLIILVIFEWNLNFLNSFSKNIQISNFLKICHWESSYSHADRRTETRTDMMKLIVAIHNFVNASEEDERQFEIYLRHCCPTKLHTTLPVNNWDTTKRVQTKDQDLTKEHKYWGLEIGFSLLPTVEGITRRVSGIQTSSRRFIALERKWNEVATPNSLTAQQIRSVSVWWKSYNICSLWCRNRYPHWINAWGHNNQECMNTPGHISSRASLQPDIPTPHIAFRTKASLPALCMVSSVWSTL
jgi:hypothetical protein